MRQCISLAFLLLLSISGVAQVAAWYKTPESRRVHALQLQKEFEGLNAQVPTLSPSEEKWLKTEYDDTIQAAGGVYTKRAISAMQSRAWNLRVAKSDIWEILAVLGPLTRQQTQIREAREWTRVATLLMDYNFWQAIKDLQERDIIEKGDLKFLGDFPRETAAVWAQQILTEIVIPYFDSQPAK